MIKIADAVAALDKTAETYSQALAAGASDAKLLGRVGMGLGGAATGSVGGGALGGLLHYVMADEKKRRLSDYLRSIVGGGLVGGGAGAALGASDIGLGALNDTLNPKRPLFPPSY